MSWNTHNLTDESDVLLFEAFVDRILKDPITGNVHERLECCTPEVEVRVDFDKLSLYRGLAEPGDSRVTIYAKNITNEHEALGVFIHEATHMRDALVAGRIPRVNGRYVNTFRAEYRARRNELAFILNRVPTLRERQVIITEMRREGYTVETGIRIAGNTIREGSDAGNPDPA